MQERQEAAGLTEGAGAPVTEGTFRLIYFGLDLDIDEARVAKNLVEESTRRAVEEGRDPAFVAGGIWLDGVGVGILIGEARGKDR